MGRADPSHLGRARLAIFVCHAVFSYPARGRPHLGADHRRGLCRLGDLGGRARHKLRKRAHLCAHLRGNRLLIDGHVRVERARTVIHLLRHLVERVRERSNMFSRLDVRRLCGPRLGFLVQPARGHEKPVHRTIKPVTVLPPDTRPVQVVRLRLLLPQTLEESRYPHGLQVVARAVRAFGVVLHGMFRVRGRFLVHRLTRHDRGLDGLEQSLDPPHQARLS